MRIRLWSDLHLEFGPFEPPSLEGVDVVVLAGDIDLKGRGIEFAKSLDRPVVYVAGNHEYYGNAIPRFTDKLREACVGTQVHFLEREAVVIGRTRFLGTTLWTNWKGDGTHSVGVAHAHAVGRMNDYKRIRVSPRFGKLRPNETLRWHFESVAWLKGELESPHEGPTVVVTHHAPLLDAVETKDRGTPLHGADASALESMMGRMDAWVFGHTHVAYDAIVSGTRVVSNPRGYVGEFVPGFRPALDLDIRE
ncbi:MAG: metallophosphoesterase [Archangium sp.]